MNASAFAHRVHDVLARKQAFASPEAARARFEQHIRNWEQDLVERRDFYTRVVEQVALTLAPDHADVLRRIWGGCLQHVNAETDDERHEIDAWLHPLSDTPAPPGHLSWMDILMDCEGGYFTEAIEAELRELVRVPGFDEVPLFVDWERQ